MRCLIFFFRCTGSVRALGRGLQRRIILQNLSQGARILQIQMQCKPLLLLSHPDAARRRHRPPAGRRRRHRAGSGGSNRLRSVYIYDPDDNLIEIANEV